MDRWIRENVSAILLAAGLSRRMGGRDKLLLPCAGQTLLARAAALLDSLPFREKILVTTVPRLEQTALPPGITSVLNPHPEAGMGESLRLGVTAATGEAYLFLPADQPLLEPSTLLWLLRAARDNAGKIVYPSVGGEPRSPALFPARFRPELLALPGDSGGRGVRLAHPEDCLALEAENPAAFLDVDTGEDYALLLRNNREIWESCCLP